LGALLAFYEHRTFVNAVLLGINPFDQFGVELGKEIARSIDSGGAVEFVASIEPGDDLDPDHHRQLLVNCFAQGAALMAGRGSDDPNRVYPGDRPSTTILLDRLDPRTLGALIAFYEQRAFANAALLGINPFDQFGVELGKEMAKAMDGDADLVFDPSTEALIARAFGD
jgi:glucose-6-phosphate isomerase